MPQWLDYTQLTSSPDHTVVGKVRVLPDVESPQLGNRRDILIYLPPSHGLSERRYPVIYMHDGQNLFDAATSFSGEWQVDETMEQLATEDLEAIVVGLPNAARQRLHEYSPFDDPRFGKGQGDAYLDFILNTVKPLVDNDFNTLPDCAHTGIIGSSMGGLISLYAFFSRPDAFGFAGVMSPALWFARRSIFNYVAEAKFTPGKIYLDAGTKERYLVKDAAHMRDILSRKGYRLGTDLAYVEEQGADHHESAWARRLPDALRFLLKK